MKIKKKKINQTGFSGAAAVGLLPLHAASRVIIGGEGVGGEEVRKCGISNADAGRRVASPEEHLDPRTHCSAALGCRPRKVPGQMVKVTVTVV